MSREIDVKRSIHQVVNLLYEEMMKQNIESVAVAAVLKDGKILTCWSHTDKITSLLGTLRFLEHDLVKPPGDTE